MDIFKQDPLASNPFQNEAPISQMSRTPPPVDTTVEKGLGQQATEMATNKVMGDALNYGTTEAYNKGAAMFAPATPTMSSVATPLMKSGVDVGLSNALAAQTTGATMGAGTAAANTAAAGAAGSGAMAALGTAIPYVGLGLLAGKAFGLFNKGGPVYAQEGAPIGPLAIRKIKYKRNGGKITEEFEVSS